MITIKKWYNKEMDVYKGFRYMTNNIYYIVIIATAAAIALVLKEVFGFVQKAFPKKDEPKEKPESFITFQYFDEAKDKMYEDLVKKSEHAKDMENVMGKLKDIENEQKLQADKNEALLIKIMEIDKNVALVQKDVGYLAEALRCKEDK